MPSKMSLSPSGHDHLTVKNVEVPKSKTLSRDTNFTASRSIQATSKNSIYRDKRSESSKPPIESLMTTSRALSNVNSNLLQIPQTNILFVPTEGEEEKSVSDTRSDYLNKVHIEIIQEVLKDK